MRSGLIIVSVVSLVLAVAIFRGHTQAHLLYYQYRVAHLQLPADQVVYKFSPALAAALGPLPLFEFASTPPQPKVAPQYPSTEGDDDNCEILPPHTIPAGGAGDPPGLDMFNAYMHYILTDGMQVLYAHAHTLNGQRRLVIVQFGDNGHYVLHRGMFEVIVLEPAGLSTLPRQLSRQRFPAASLNVPYATTRFFAGQPDAGNPAAFALSFEQRGQRHQLTATLTPDARHISFQRAD